MAWVPPFKQFQAGYRTFKVKVCETADEYLRQHARHELQILRSAQREKACTVQTASLILINEEEHDEDEALLLHSFFHEVLHACWFAMGRHTSEHHDEIEIVNLAGVLTQVYLTRK